MSISCTCTGCGHIMTVHPHYAGRTLRCTRCGVSFVAPAAAAAAPPPPPPAAGAAAGGLYCWHCGTLNTHANWQCVQCGASLAAPSAPAPATGSLSSVSVQNYLMPSILATVFCCWPVGIPGIIAASQVNQKLAAGDLVGATEASRKAKMWTWWAFGAGLSVGLIYLLIAILVAVFGEH